MNASTRTVNWKLVDTIAFRLFKFIVGAWLITLIVAEFSNMLNPLVALGLLVATFIVERLIIRVWNYGFHRRTDDDVWEDRYDSSIATRDKLNRRATMCWLLGRKSHALMLIEHADWVWLDAQLALIHEEGDR